MASWTIGRHSARPIWATKIGANDCEVTFKHLHQPLRSYMQNFRILPKPFLMKWLLRPMFPPKLTIVRREGVVLTFFLEVESWYVRTSLTPSLFQSILFNKSGPFPNCPMSIMAGRITCPEGVNILNRIQTWGFVQLFIYCPKPKCILLWFQMVSTEKLGVI